MSSRQCDVAVVGAGFSGLLLAALLAKRGRRVTVLDENQRPGGLSSNPAVDYGYLPGPSLFLGFERDGLYDRLFAEMGLSLSLLKRDTALFARGRPALQVVLRQHRLDWPSDWAGLEEELGREFPESLAGIKGLLTRLQQLDTVLYPAYQLGMRRTASGMAESVEMLRERWQVASTARASAGVRVADRIEREGIVNGFSRVLDLLLLLFVGRPTTEATEQDLALLFGLLQREIATVVGGLPTLCDILIKVLSDHHGEVLLGTPVRRLMVQHKRVVGLELDAGEVAVSGAVYVNPPAAVLPQFETPPEMAALYFGVDAGVVPVMMKDHLLFSPSDDRPAVGDNFLFLSLIPPADTAPREKARRTVRVTTVVDGDAITADNIGRELGKPVRDHLAWLMPFSDGCLEFMGAEIRPDDGGRAARMTALLTEFLPAARRIERRGAVHYTTGLRNLLLVPDESIRPVASTAAARSAQQAAELMAKLS